MIDGRKRSGKTPRLQATRLRVLKKMFKVVPFSVREQINRSIWHGWSCDGLSSTLPPCGVVRRAKFTFPSGSLSPKADLDRSPRGVFFVVA